MTQIVQGVIDKESFESFWFKLSNFALQETLAKIVRVMDGQIYFLTS